MAPCCSLAGGYQQVFGNIVASSSGILYSNEKEVACSFESLVPTYQTVQYQHSE
jgi:hypothetical protein